MELFSGISQGASGVPILFCLGVQQLGGVSSRS